MDTKYQVRFLFINFCNLTYKWQEFIIKRINVSSLITSIGTFFNGNLSDGSCLLVGEFGDHISDENKVGLILNVTENDLKIYIVQNDRPLGE